MTLSDAIGRDVFTMDTLRLTDEDFKAMSIDALETAKLRISLGAERLQNSIKAKQIDYQNGGEGMTSEWFINHRTALSIYRRVVPYISMILRRKYQAERRLSDFFMDEAELYLSKDDFQTILENAKYRRQAAEGVRR